MVSVDIKHHVYLLTSQTFKECANPVRAPDLWLKGHGFESLQERQKNFILQGQTQMHTNMSDGGIGTAVKKFRNSYWTGTSWGQLWKRRKNESGWIRVQELCESRGGRPGLSFLTSLMVSVDVKQYWTMLTHWSQLVPNMSADIQGH